MWVQGCTGMGHLLLLFSGTLAGIQNRVEHPGLEMASMGMPGASLCAGFLSCFARSVFFRIPTRAVFQVSWGHGTR